LTKLIDTVLGWFSTKSKIYSITEMVDAISNENIYFTGDFAGNILGNLASLIEKEEKKEDEKKDDKKEKKKDDK
jgi:hypothetical protein